jgi:hypothetical protein
VEFRNLISGEAVKGFTAGTVVTVLLWIGQAWRTSDLEYKQVSINDYLSTPSTTFGKQGLTMTYEGESLKNVSVAHSTDFCHPVHGKVATQSMGRLPPSPREACHVDHRKVVTYARRSLPPPEQRDAGCLLLV